MRYYDITLTPPNGGPAVLQYTSHPQGVFNPAALEVEFDLPVAPQGVPMGGQTLSVHGISLADISQAQNFAGMNLTLKGGMQAGLPLANLAQAGVIVQGQVFQSYANWIGTDMTLDFVLYAPIHTVDAPGNIVLSWKAGTSLADALKATLGIAYPSVPLDIVIGTQYIAPADRIHIAPTLDDLALFVGDTTENLFQSRVSIAMQAGRLRVFDASYQPAPVSLVFTDLIGQPTWIDQFTTQVKTVMRADIQIGSLVTMPQGMQSVPGFVTTQAASMPSSLKYQSTFQGTFQVIAMRHLGSYRSPDAGDWATVFNLVPASVPSGA